MVKTNLRKSLTILAALLLIVGGQQATYSANDYSIELHSVGIDKEFDGTLSGEEYFKASIKSNEFGPGVCGITDSGSCGASVTLGGCKVYANLITYIKDRHDDCGEPWRWQMLSSSSVDFIWDVYTDAPDIEYSNGKPLYAYLRIPASINLLYTVPASDRLWTGIYARIEAYSKFHGSTQSDVDVVNKHFEASGGVIDKISNESNSAKIELLPNGWTRVGIDVFANSYSGYNTSYLPLPAFIQSRSSCSVRWGGVKRFSYDGNTVTNITVTGLNGVDLTAPIPTPTLPEDGDVDTDGGLDYDDVSLILAHWLETGCDGVLDDPNDWCFQTDLNRDGTVSLRDFVILANRWTQDRAQDTP